MKIPITIEFWGGLVKKMKVKLRLSDNVSFVPLSKGVFGQVHDLINFFLEVSNSDEYFFEFVGTEFF